MYFRRIRDLRDDNNKTQQDIADLLHCQVTVYRRYESGEREIPISMLIKLNCVKCIDRATIVMEFSTQLCFWLFLFSS